MKYKVGITIESEVLFGLIAKLMPPGIHDFHVEEIFEHQPTKQPTIAKMVEKIAIEKPKERKKYGPPFKHPSGRTLQDLVLEHMNEVKHPLEWRELSKHAKSLGFHSSSINNAVSRLSKNKQIIKIGPGKYKLTEYTTKKAG